MRRGSEREKAKMGGLGVKKMIRKNTVSGGKIGGRGKGKRLERERRRRRYEVKEKDGRWGMRRKMKGAENAKKMKYMCIVK